MKNSQSLFSITIALAALSFLAWPRLSSAHCQIPCGIFHDDLVFATLEQNVETLQKADHELSESTLSTNQSVRWILNKETQCDQVAQTMLTYFLQQRVKTDDPKRSEKLNLIAIICMQCAKVKQTVDIHEVTTLGKEIMQLKELCDVVKMK
jgi:nickel superoxide dismutase